MKRYSKKSQEKVEAVMQEFKTGKLKSGKDGKGGVVKSRKQAIAIGLSEARAVVAKVPMNSKVVSKGSSKKAAESCTEKKPQVSESAGKTSSSKVKSVSAGKTAAR